MPIRLFVPLVPHGSDGAPRARLAIAAVVAVTLAPCVPGVSAADAQPPAADTAGRSVVVRGIVRGPNDEPVPDALVLVRPVRAPDAPGVTVDSIRADGRGAYRVQVAPAARYTITAVHIGFGPGTREVLRQDSLVVAAVRLQRLPTVLQAVSVRARRTPLRPYLQDFGVGSDVGGSQAVVSNVGTLTPNDAGNLTAIAATIPGVTPVRGTDGRDAGFSVLGLPPAQNVVTLNGLPLSSTQIPNAAFTLPRVVTTSYDPTVGGFSGAQLALTLYPGSNYTFGNMVVQYDDPALQLGNAAGRAFGQQFRNVQVSGARTGPVLFDRVFYSLAAQGGYRRTSGLATLADAGTGSLADVGLSPATARRILRTLDSLGIRSSPGIGGESATGSGALLARIDLFPTATRSLNVTTSGAWSRTDPTLLGPATAASSAARSSRASGGVQMELARYVAERFLSRTRSGVSVSRTADTPLSTLPSGRVLAVSTSPENASGALASVLFGAASGLPRRSSTWSWETSHDLSWFAAGSRHRPKVAADIRLDGATYDAAGDRYGTFSFLSVDDLGSGRPASYSRTLRAQPFAGRSANGWVGAGDLWRLTDRLSVQYGVRAEGTALDTHVARDAALDSLFGMRTGTTVRTVDLLPRLGATWSYGHVRTGVGGAANTPRGTLSGGIGRFRALLTPALLGPTLAGAGFGSGGQQIVCTGTAVPVPDWAAYAAGTAVVPTECAAGVSGFTSLQPSAAGLDPAFDAARTWRGNVAWTVRIPGHLRLALNAVLSRTQGLQGLNDRNFTAAGQSFQLRDEGGRPVFAAPASIDPATGTVDPSTARQSSRYARVYSVVSDLDATSRQFTVSLSPTSSGFFFTRTWSLGYALTRSTDGVRGFDGAASGDPRRVDRAPSVYDVRHSFSGNLGWQVGEHLFVTAGAQLRSGLPFTPLVAGDVNGDGRANDRAFVFAPDAAPDSAVATGMRRLLTGAPSAVRHCLGQQFGTVAGRNSCRGPWTTVTNLGFSLDGALLRLPPRSRFSVTLSNPIAAADRLLHGADGLRGWGQVTPPDPILLYVRGFDPERQRFRYEVNPRMGDARPTTIGLRTPFLVTVAVSVPTGAPQARQTLDQILAAGRTRGGERLTASQIKARYLQGVPQPVQSIVRARDTLLLTQEQLMALRTIDRRYQAAIDSAYTPVAEYLALLDDRFRTRDVMPRLRVAQTAVWDAREAAAAAMRALLTPDQIELLATDLRAQLDAATLQRSRRGELKFFY